MYIYHKAHVLVMWWGAGCGAGVDRGVMVCLERSVLHECGNLLVIKFSVTIS